MRFIREKATISVRFLKMQLLANLLPKQ